jgi:hypothetical protein
MSVAYFLEQLFKCLGFGKVKTAFFSKFTKPCILQGKFNPYVPIHLHLTCHTVVHETHLVSRKVCENLLNKSPFPPCSKKLPFAPT